MKYFSLFFFLCFLSGCATELSDREIITRVITFETGSGRIGYGYQVSPLQYITALHVFESCTRLNCQIEQGGVRLAEIKSFAFSEKSGDRALFSREPLTDYVTAVPPAVGTQIKIYNVLTNRAPIMATIRARDARFVGYSETLLTRELTGIEIDRAFAPGMSGSPVFTENHEFL